VDFTAPFIHEKNSTNLLIYSTLPCRREEDMDSCTHAADTDPVKSDFFLRWKSKTIQT